MAYTTIDDPSAYFQTKLYTGTNNELVLTFDGNSNLQPDMIWTKNRSRSSTNHVLSDTVRGIGKGLYPDLANAEGDTNYISAIGSNGYTIVATDSVEINRDDDTFVSWNWKAGTTGSGTTNGSKAYSYSASPDAGFSVVTYTGNATAGHLIPHGMGKVPRLIHVKSRADDNGWTSGTIGSASAWNDHGYLYLANAFGTDANQFGATPDTTNFRLGTGTGTNGNNGTRFAMCFADVQGYQKIGKFVGNGNADGTFVFCGFKPAYIMYKKLSAVGRWSIRDNKRDSFNVATKGLEANGSTAENTGSQYWDLDMLSNGFKLRTTEHESNGAGLSFVFLAIAENPFVTSTGVPATAR